MDHVRRRVAERPARLRGERKRVTGKARTELVGKEVIAEGERFGVRPVVRDARLVVLSPCQVIPEHAGSRDVFPAIHVAVGPVRERAVMRVAEIPSRAIRSARTRKRRPILELAGRGAFGPREASEVIVEGVVLFDDDDHVLDGHSGASATRAAGRTSAAGRAPARAAGRTSSSSRVGRGSVVPGRAAAEGQDRRQHDVCAPHRHARVYHVEGTSRASSIPRPRANSTSHFRRRSTSAGCMWKTSRSRPSA